jgi:hypothetical protein
MTPFGAAARIRCLKYSAIRKSLLSCRCRPCSLLSAPRGMTITASGVKTRSASSQVRFSSRTAWACLCEVCWAAGLVDDCVQPRGVMMNDKKDMTTDHRVGLFMQSAPRFLLSLLGRRGLFDEWSRCLGIGFRLKAQYCRKFSPDRLSHKESHIDLCPGDGLSDGKRQTGSIVPFN